MSFELAENICLHHYIDGWLARKEKRKYWYYWFVLNGKLNTRDQLENACLSWFKSADTKAQNQFVGSTEIIFPGSVVLLKSSKSKFTFKIQFNHTKFNFKAVDDETRQRWIYAFCNLVGKRLPPLEISTDQVKSVKDIQYTINFNKEYQKYNPSKKVSKGSKFWNQRVLSSKLSDEAHPRLIATIGSTARKFDHDDKIKQKKEESDDNDDSELYDDLQSPAYSQMLRLAICYQQDLQDKKRDDESNDDFDKFIPGSISHPRLIDLLRPKGRAHPRLIDLLRPKGRERNRKSSNHHQHHPIMCNRYITNNYVEESDDNDDSELYGGNVIYDSFENNINKFKEALSKVVVDNQESQKMFMKFFYESKAPITDEIKASIDKHEWGIFINEETTRYEVIYQEYFLDCFTSHRKIWRLIVSKNILTKDEINLIIKCSTNICDAIFYCAFEMDQWKPSKTIEWLTIDIQTSLISKKDFKSFYPWISVCEGLSLFLHDQTENIEEIQRYIQDQSNLKEFFIEHLGNIFATSKY